MLKSKCVYIGHVTCIVKLFSCNALVLRLLPINELEGLAVWQQENVSGYSLHGLFIMRWKKAQFLRYNVMYIAGP